MNKKYSVKYKKFSKDLSIITKALMFSIRFYKFKKSKWKLLKNFLLKLENSKEIYFQPRFLFLKKYNWKKTKKTYKLSVIAKTFLNLYYNKAFTKNQYKKVLKKTNLVNNLFFSKLFYQLDILLWKLNIFSSTREVRQACYSKQILLNNTILNNICELKKGDVISIEKFTLKKAPVNLTFFLSFCEIDYYTRKIIILKNFNELSDMDLSLIFRNKIEFQILKNYYI